MAGIDNVSPLSSLVVVRIDITHVALTDQLDLVDMYIYLCIYIG